MKIEKADSTDARKLTALTIRSKDYWNYGAEQIKAWQNDLTVSETYILEKEVYKLTIKNDVIGYYSYVESNESEVKLENLFIEPKFIRKGFGKMLMNDFLERVKSTKFKRIVLEADPNAENFYKQIGFKVVGKLETSIKDRFLPIMEMKIADLQ